MSEVFVEKMTAAQFLNLFKFQYENRAKDKPMDNIYNETN